MNTAERKLRERLDELEKRVKELESRPVFVPQPYPVAVPVYPLPFNPYPWYVPPPVPWWQQPTIAPFTPTCGTCGDTVPLTTTCGDPFGSVTGSVDTTAGSTAWMLQN